MVALLIKLSSTDFLISSRYVDPVARYLHYEHAYLAGELDPAFPVLTTFEIAHAMVPSMPSTSFLDAFLTHFSARCRHVHVWDALYQGPMLLGC